MRRYLVLTNESARHPFRQTLPDWVKLEKPAGNVGSDRSTMLALLRTWLGCFTATLIFLS